MDFFRAVTINPSIDKTISTAALSIIYLEPKKEFQEEAQKQGVDYKISKICFTEIGTNGHTYDYVVGKDGEILRQIRQNQMNYVIRNINKIRGVAIDNLSEIFETDQVTADENIKLVIMTSNLKADDKISFYKKEKLTHENIPSKLTSFFTKSISLQEFVDISGKYDIDRAIKGRVLEQILDRKKEEQSEKLKNMKFYGQREYVAEAPLSELF